MQGILVADKEGYHDIIEYPPMDIPLNRHQAVKKAVFLVSDKFIIDLLGGVQRVRKSLENP